MSPAAIRPPHLTESAQALLAGRAVHVRSSPRHGCCGGAASLPVAEPTTQEVPGAERFDVEGAVVFVDGDLLGAGGAWTIDTDGFARWRRLVVLGVEFSPG